MLGQLKLKKETINLKSFHIDDEKLLEKYKAIWTNIEDLKNIELNLYQPVKTYVRDRNMITDV